MSFVISNLQYGTWNTVSDIEYCEVSIVLKKLILIALCFCNIILTLLKSWYHNISTLAGNWHQTLEPCASLDKYSSTKDTVSFLSTVMSITTTITMYFHLPHHRVSAAYLIKETMNRTSILDIIQHSPFIQQQAKHLGPSNK